ncbi:hypothetical protein ACF09L_06580 [Streptomyces sp. NPDC014779]|uniref:hypothetical protein n=1 Tax=unclassified Streptomyces TaxID=2593676 RepID=UPI0036FF3E94
MCFYAEKTYKPHYVCVSCRLSFKRFVRLDRPAPCPGCGGPLARAGRDFAAPPRRDRAAWSVVAAVLAAGLTYDGHSPCGCDRTPSPRPRTRAALRRMRQEAR